MPFDEGKAQRVIDFIEKLCTHIKGRWAGQRFGILDWQRDLIWNAFGTVKDSGYRQYRFVYNEIPKKNGKSELAAAVALYLLCGDGEDGAEVYSAACDRDQAALVFNVAAAMVRNNKNLSKKLKIIDSRKRIVYYGRNSYYQVLSSESFWNAKRILVSSS